MENETTLNVLAAEPAVTACIHKITWKRIEFDTRPCVLWWLMFQRLVWHMADRWAPGCIGWLLENVKAGKCCATEARPYHLSIQDRPRLATARSGLRVTVTLPHVECALDLAIATESLLRAWVGF